MLRITTLKMAADYYTKSLSKDDYRSEQSEVAGQWCGQGADKLGLTGKILNSQFDLLCGGHHPLTTEKLTARIGSNRREAYDFTFSVPKSVSLLLAFSSPEVYTLLHNQIVDCMKLTMDQVESNMQTRVRDLGKNDNRVTGNLLYGYFVHKNARPLAGYSDPHTHIHAVVMNLTFDPVEHKWKALQIRDKLENCQYYNSIFNSTLALKLQNLGIPIRKTAGDFDLAGITDQTIKAFSRRTAQIEAEAVKQKIYSPNAKDQLGARTRQFKSHKYTQSQLQSIYKTIISPQQKNIYEGFELKLTQQLKNLDRPLKTPSQFPNTRKWLDYTLENHYERHSTSSEQRLIGEVLQNGIGQTNLEAVTSLIEQYKQNGILIDELSAGSISLERIQARNNLSPAITTQIALLEEQNIIKLIDARLGEHSPISLRYSDQILQDKYLNQNQREVVSKIFTNSDGVTLLEGKAGTGKTTTLKALYSGLEQEGYTTTVLAPTIKAVEVLQLDGFEQAMTVSKYLAQPSQNSDQNLSNQLQQFQQYLIIDEASLVSVRQLNRLLQTSSKTGQRVLLVGDIKQHKSVERGNILQTLQDYSQIRSYSLYQIQRQVHSQAKLAVQDLATGQTVAGIEKFNQLGFVQEIPSDNIRLQRMANLYLQHLPQVYKTKIQKEQIRVEVPNPDKPKSLLNRITTIDIFGQAKQYQLQDQLISQKIEYKKLDIHAPTLVITPTHKDGARIHTAIRQVLKANNLIDSEDHTIQIHRSLGWSQAQKAEISNYQLGQVVQFSKNIQQFTTGERFLVIPERNQIKHSTQQSQVCIQNIKNGLTVPVPTHLASYFDVVQTESLEVSKNDLIQTEARHRLQDTKGRVHYTAKGSIYQIKSISSRSGEITLHNNWVIPKNFGAIKSAYYSTSHASQGRTVKHSIFYTSNQSLHLLSQEMVYVSNSRFKLTNTILTPNISDFNFYAQRGEIKPVALSVLGSGKQKAKLKHDLEDHLKPLSPIFSQSLLTPTAVVPTISKKLQRVNSKGVQMGR